MLHVNVNPILAYTWVHTLEYGSEETGNSDIFYAVVTCFYEAFAPISI